jgi:hypothetical protein
MPSRPERRWPAIAAGYLILLAVVAIVTTIMDRFAEPAYRPSLVRAAAGLMLGVVLFHARAVVRRSLESDPSSMFDAALVRAAAAPVLDRLFEQLWSEIRFGAGSASYFEHVLWPRLSRLHADVDGDGALAKPSGRRWLGRGPSLEALGEAVAAVERAARRDER